MLYYGKRFFEYNAPSIYDERLLDSTGVYDPDLLDKEKMRIVDNIYQQGQIQYYKRKFENITTDKGPLKSAQDMIKDTTIAIEEKGTEVVLRELGLEHQLFFASHPIENDDLNSLKTDPFIYVRVDGNQTVKNNYRLQIRLNKAANIYEEHYAKNTPIYGFVSFKPNRTIIDIEHINHKPVKLKAHDFQDGSEGIYIENSFRAEITNELIGDMVEDINIPGVPQVSGIKNVFRRNQRNVRVTVLDNYQLIIKISKQKNNFQFN
ncbi:hypothetical protein BUL40_09310 [Croceivirga radicis]|uniref:Conjugative transposon TraM C-terminal domain-containing protein n=1 Tax=Croceivirga radicis TaxID=1929488 RepID=A0A1V6LRI0_9FLAO|nr:conjugative transposon protein TraM [Croceivirga radicis]OQD42709.1 hypothetical protein BUL40_09310 [Croceivirga radicis]